MLPAAPDEALGRVTEDRRLAKAAHRATSQRLADLTPGSRGYRAAGELVRYWDRTLGELDRQLTELTMHQETASTSSGSCADEADPKPGAGFHRPSSVSWQGRARR